MKSLFFHTLFTAVVLSAYAGTVYATGTSNYNITRSVIAPTYGAYPAKGELRVDPITGAGMKRIADHSELTGDYAGSTHDQSLIVYSRYTPTNTTNEFVLIHGVNSTSAWIYRLSDNTMRTVLRMKPSLGASSRSLGEVNELRWDYSGAHPYRLYFVGNNISSSQAVGSENPGMSFYYTDIDPVTGAQAAPVLIHDFSAEFPSAGTYPTGGYVGNYLSNDVEGDSSNDSRYWAWLVMDPNTGGQYAPRAIITYDKTTNKILGRAQRNCAGVASPCTVVNTPATSSPYISKPNMVEISPLGTRVVIDWGRTYTGNRAADAGTVADGPKGFLKDFTDPIRIGADETHSGWAWGPNGEEMFVSQNNRNDYIEAVNIATSATANCTLISDNSYTCGTKVIAYDDLDGNNWTLGMHFGKVYDQSKRGWLFMNTYDNATYNTWGKNQNLFIEIKAYNASPAPKVWRVSPSYNTNFDYRSEGSGALSFDANALYATANWGYVDGRGEAYSIGLPDNWYQYFNGSSDVTAPTVTSFLMPSTSTSLTVSVSAYTATDDKAVTGYLITESATKPSPSAVGWTTTAPAVFTFTGSGARTAYAWAKDANFNVSLSLSKTVTISLPPDLIAPTVTTFTMPSTATSLTVPVSSFTATDNTAVTGYIITESAAPPLVSAPGWTTTAPTSFAFAGYGSRTAYAWVRDFAGNISIGVSTSCTITQISSVRATSSNSAASGTEITVSAPSGTTTGDVVLVFINANVANNTTSDNNGSTPFTQDVVNYQQDPSWGDTVSVFSRRIQAGDPTTYSFSKPIDARWSVIAVTIQNPHPSNIYDVAPVINLEISPVTSFNTNSISTKTDNALHIVMAASDISAPCTITTPTGYSNSTVVANQPMGIATKFITTGGTATGIQTFVFSAAAPSIGVSLAIALPAVVSSNTPPKAPAGLTVIK